MFVAIASIQVVKGEVIATLDDPELVLLPVVIIDNKAVRITWACRMPRAKSADGSGKCEHSSKGYQTAAAPDYGSGHGSQAVQVSKCDLTDLYCRLSESH